MTIQHLGGIGLSDDLDLFLCNATPFLEAFSKMVMLWSWTKQAIVAQKALDAGSNETDFYTAKLETARFYARRKAPEAVATLKTVQSNERTALDFKPEWF